MSTPNPPDWTTPSIIIPGAQDVRDETQKFRESIDLSQTVNAQVQSTEQLLQSMIEKMGGLAASIQSIPEAFSDTVGYIKRSTDATEQLAEASKKVTAEQEKGSRHVDRTRASIKDVIASLAQGNLGGAISEGFQALPFTGGIRGKLTGAGQVTQAAGIIRGGAGGLAMRGAGMALGASAGLLTPAAIYGAYKLYDNVNKQHQEMLRIGALTGEGAGAGFAATGINLPIFGRVGGEAGAIRGTATDLISSADAMEIVKGTRGAGFRGKEARNTEEAIAGMINDLGIGVQDAMAIAIPAIKDAGMSTSELATQMSTLDDTAKASRIGIMDLTKSIGGLITDLSAQSREVAQGAAGTTQDLLKQFQGTLAGRSPGTFTGLQGGTSREALAQLSGFAPFEAYTPEFARNFQRNFTRVLIQLAQAKPEGLGWNLYVHEILLNPMYQQLFGSTPVPQIIDMLNKAWEGSKHGTQTSQYLRKTASDSAQQSSNSISESFSQLMNQKKKVSLGKGGGGKGAGGMVDPSLVQSKGLEAQKGVEQILNSLGISGEQRAAILDPIRKAVKAGDWRATEKALGHVDDAIKGAQGQIKVHTTVGFDPRSARMLKSLNTGQVDALRGHRGTQGTDIHQ